MKTSLQAGQKKPNLLSSFVGYFLLIMLGVVALVLLQHQYWNGEFGYHNLAKLRDEVKKQEQLNADQLRHNQVLEEDIKDLKSGLVAIEEHARLDLGFIKKDETFVQLSTASSGDDGQMAVGTDKTPATEPIDEFDENPPAKTP